MRANVTTFVPSAPGVSETIGVFETARESAGISSVTCQGTFTSGSSKQGNARRAKMDSNWVNAYQASPSFWWKMPSVLFGSTRPVYAIDSTTWPAGIS